MCDLPASCFWASQATANYISSASLLVSALTLVFLIIYVRATGKIAKASVEQVEASFRPAIVAQSESGSVAAFPLLKNIGKGQRWRLNGQSPTRPSTAKSLIWSQRSLRNCRCQREDRRYLQMQHSREAKIRLR